METKLKKAKKVFVGNVVSTDMDKTAVVEMVVATRHKDFGKVIKKVKKYKVHDEKDELSVGDTIEFYEGRPVSKTKHMYLSRVITKNTLK